MAWDQGGKAGAAIRPARVCSTPLTRRTTDWEALARSGAYFPLLTSDGTSSVAGSGGGSEEFFATGEEDIASLLATLAFIFRQELTLRTALDFGCGTGRLTIPLARRADRVTACDIAPTMLRHTRENAAAANLQNVTCLSPAELFDGSERAFDFVCSLLTFQHISPLDGYPLLAKLLGLLLSGGVATVHVTLKGRASRLRQLARATDRKQSDPLTVPTYVYDERTLLEIIESAGARVAARHATHDGRTAGAVLIIQRE